MRGDYKIAKAVLKHVMLYTWYNVHVRSDLMNISYSLISHYFWCWASWVLFLESLAKVFWLHCFPAHTLLRALAATRKHLLFMPNFTDVFLFSFFQPFFRSILPDQGICAAPPASRTCFLVDVGFSQLHRGNLLSITVPDSLGPKLSSYHSHRTLFPTECLQAGYSVSMFKEGGWLTEAAQLCLRSCTPNSCVLQSKSMNKCTKVFLQISHICTRGVGCSIERPALQSGISRRYERANEQMEIFTFYCTFLGLFGLGFGGFFWENLSCDFYYLDSLCISTSQSH